MTGDGAVKAEGVLRSTRGSRFPPLAALGALIVGLVVVCAACAGVVAPRDPDEQAIGSRLKPPGFEGHVLGTDELGRDILSRVIYGSRVTLLVSVVGVLISGPIGIGVGLVAGYAGRRVDDVLMRITDVQLAIPTVLFAIAVVAVLGPGLRNVIVTLGLTLWTFYARLVRGETMAVREREYVEAARALGARAPRVVLRHVLPNVAASAIVIATFSVANMIILESTLSFLGLGAEPSTITWGSMLNNGRLYMTTAWWLTAWPGLAIFATVLGVNLLGDHLRDVLDPMLRV